MTAGSPTYGTRAGQGRIYGNPCERGQGGATNDDQRLVEKLFISFGSREFHIACVGQLLAGCIYQYIPANSEQLH